MGSFGSVFLIMNELVETRQKDKFNCILFCYWAGTAILLAPIVYYWDNWRLLWLLLALMQLILTPVFYCFLLESPRYLVIYKKDFQGAKDVLR